MPNPENMMISLILPAYNEEVLIQASLKKINEFAQKEFNEYEIIVVDDGSTDQTANCIRAWINKNRESVPNFNLLINQKNQGKGQAIRRAMQSAKGDLCIFIDSDLPFDLSVLQKLVSNYEDGADIIIGDRNDPKSVLSKISPIRHVAGKIYSNMVQYLLKNTISDTQCGLKGFSENAVKMIFTRTLIDGFGFDVEVLYIAERLGLRIDKVPVQMTSTRSESRVHLLKDSFEMFRNLFMIKRNDSNGLYSLKK